MERRENYRKPGRDNGFILIGVLILMAVGVLVMFGALNMNTSNIRTTKATELRSERYMAAEAAVGKALAWLQLNSKKLLTPFSRSNVYSTFDFGTPSVGDNDGSLFSLSTTAKLSGTTDSVILTNSSDLGTSEFPYTVDPDTGLEFDPESDFQNVDFDGALVKITLVNVTPGDPAYDYGPPPAASPDTDFVPIYRIDALTDDKSRAHVYSYVVTELLTGSPGDDDDDDDDDDNGDDDDDNGDDDDDNGDDDDDNGDDDDDNGDDDDDNGDDDDDNGDDDDDNGDDDDDNGDDDDDNG